MGIEQLNGATPPTEKKEKEVTIKDIMTDGKQSALFGEFVVAKTPKGGEIAERMLTGKATKEDRAELVKQMEPFLHQQREVARISKALTPDFVKRLVGQSPKLQILAKEGGAEGIREVVLSQLETVAMRDPGRFAKMVASYDLLIQRTEIINKQIETLCKANNITVDEYMKILNETPDDAERQKKLQTHIRQGTGSIRRYQKSGKEDINQKVNNLNSIDQINDAKKEYDSELKRVGEFLATSVNDNDDLNNAFNRVVFNEKGEEKEEVGGFEEMRGMTPSEEDMKKEWEEEWNKEEAKQIGMTKDDHKNDFQKKYLASHESKTEGKKGVWNNVITRFIQEAISRF